MTMVMKTEGVVALIQRVANGRIKSHFAGLRSAASLRISIIDPELLRPVQRRSRSCIIKMVESVLVRPFELFRVKKKDEQPLTSRHHHNAINDGRLETEEAPRVEVIRTEVGPASHERTATLLEPFAVFRYSFMSKGSLPPTKGMRSDKRRISVAAKYKQRFSVLNEKFEKLLSTTSTLHTEGKLQ